MRTTPLLLLILAAAPLRAQANPAGARGPEARRTMRAAPLTGEVRLDGRLDEPAWSAAEPAADFTQAYPRPGAPASEPTEVRVLVGPDALYVGARMYDAHPDSIVGQLSRRDDFGYSDRIAIFIDSHDDRRTAFAFGVNPRGIKVDSYQFDDGRDDPSWDAVWKVATAVDSLGWTAEFRIPFSQLRFPSRVSGPRVWGVAFMRDLARREERSTWSPWTLNSPGFASTFGELRGVDGVRVPSRPEILPYTSARVDRAPGSRLDPYYRRNDLGASMGADFHYGLPGGLTLTGTLNPDFGQVEADPAVVNLTAFETQFPEQRPFFVEGSDVFRFGTLVTHGSFAYPQYFYSRRIGRQPQLGVGGADVAFVDAPEQTTILGAAKVSGKTAGGWSVGVLDALTAREDTRYRTTAGNDTVAAAEPLTNYFLARLRRDLNQGRTVVGAMLTATDREMGDSVVRAALRSSAYVAGVDWQHAWSRRAWTVSGFLAGSRVQGSPSAIAATQRSSARYYQRPDDRSVEFDSTRTSLGGRVGGLSLAHTGSWDGSLTYQEVSPGFESNDLGFQAAAGRRGLSAYLGRRVNRPRGPFLNTSLSASAGAARNFDGDVVSAELAASGGATFRSNWAVVLSAAYDPRIIDDRLTRGGPKAAVPGAWRLSGTVASDRRRLLSASGTLSASQYGDGAYLRSLGTAVVLRPSTSLQVSVGPSYTRQFSTSQFVLSRGDTLARATFGRRYVFADVRQATLSLDTRVNWTFTPNLSLDVFAQPFVSAGDFSGYKEFLAPGRYRFGVYGRDLGTLQPATGGGFLVDPDGTGPAPAFVVGDRPGARDFTLRSLRMNAVLRWEYRPGSAVFLVWQQLRSAEYQRGGLDFGRDVPGSFGDPARNVLLVKLTYWIGR